MIKKGSILDLLWFFALLCVIYFHFKTLSHIRNNYIYDPIFLALPALILYNLSFLKNKKELLATKS